jgi:hypothetical protein
VKQAVNKESNYISRIKRATAYDCFTLASSPSRSLIIGNINEVTCYMLQAGFLLGLLFYCEDGGDMFL